MEKGTKVVILSLLASGVSLFVSAWALRQLYFLLRKARRKQEKKERQDVHVISIPDEWEKHFPTVNSHLQLIKVLGLDCEWVCDLTVGHRCPVALLQLSTAHGTTLLVRLCQMGRNVPASLKTLLEDQSVLKVGVAVKDDGKKLLKDYGISVQGCVDLRHVFARVRYPYECELSLKGLAKGILGVSLDKRSRIRCSNWEADILSQEQIEYAASDSQVGVDVFVKLVLTKLIGTEPNDLEMMLGRVDLTRFQHLTKALCQGIMDVGHKQKSHLKQKSQVKENGRKWEDGRAYSARARPLYHNCLLEAPDGQQLCTCDVRKAEWYIEKELGDKVSDDPLTVRLRFEPSGRPESENNYYLQTKENICVVCGRGDSYTRKFVVPQEYRKYFPSLLKDHRSHDILLLCPRCHQISSDNDVILRQRWAVECDAPINEGTGSPSEQNQEMMKIRSAAKALKNSRAKIPEARVKELEKTILDFFHLSDLDDTVLDSCISMDTRVFNSEYVPHGKKVVEYFQSKGQLWTFERYWRQHFIDTMKPMYLPPLWSVDHHHNGVLSTH